MRMVGQVIGAKAGGRQPSKVRVEYNGCGYIWNVSKCRSAVTRLYIDGTAPNLMAVAQLSRTSRSTLSRFLNGRRTSIATLRRILAVLRLTFDEVFEPDDAAQ